jgi:signal transduction histidine kinase
VVPGEGADTRTGSGAGRTWVGRSTPLPRRGRALHNEVVRVIEAPAGRRWHAARPRVAAGIAAAALLLAGLGAGLAVANTMSWHDLWVHFAFGELVAAVTFSVVGGTVAARAPRHPVGWLLLAIGSLAAVSLVGPQYVTRAGPDRLSEALAWIASWDWLLAVLPFAVILLVFPDGHPRWPWTRALIWAQVGLTTFGAFALAVSPIAHADGMPSWYHNPLAIAGSDRAYQLFQGLLLPSWLLAVAALALRWWRSDGEQRRQIGVFAMAGLLAVAVEALAVSINDSLGAVGYLIAWPLLAIGAGAAVLRGGLYGVDTLLSRTVVGATLTGFVALAYLALVTALGALVGRGTIAGIAATAVIAFAFHPVQRAVRATMHRLIHGTRPAPAQVLSGFAQRAGVIADDESVLADLAGLIASGIGAEAATVSLLVDGELRPDPQAGVVIPVNNGGQQVGAISARLRTGAELTAADETLLFDLAGLAGPVLRSLGLRAELRERNAELAASRARLAVAVTQERRRIERDLHDGAQQRLIAVKLRLGLAARATQRVAHGDVDGAIKAADAIETALGDADRAIDELRDLVHGIYPSALDTDGLAAALLLQGRLIALPVRLRDELPPGQRYPRDVEAAAYFCCLEALQNAVKHGQATRLDVRVWAEPDRLAFAVTDDGIGYAVGATGGAGLVNLADRTAALGGGLTVMSAPGKGTSVTGWFPTR